MKICDVVLAHEARRRLLALYCRITIGGRGEIAVWISYLIEEKDLSSTP